MAKHVCLWVDNKGQYHDTKEQAEAADFKFAQEQARKEKKNRIKTRFQNEILPGKMPMFRDYGNSYRPEMVDMENLYILSSWIAEHHEVLKEILND